MASLIQYDVPWSGLGRLPPHLLTTKPKKIPHQLVITHNLPPTHNTTPPKHNPPIIQPPPNNPKTPPPIIQHPYLQISLTANNNHPANPHKLKPITNQIHLITNILPTVLDGGDVNDAGFCRVWDDAFVEDLCAVFWGEDCVAVWDVGCDWVLLVGVGGI